MRMKIKPTKHSELSRFGVFKSTLRRRVRLINGIGLGECEIMKVLIDDRRRLRRWCGVWILLLWTESDGEHVRCRKPLLTRTVAVNCDDVWETLRLVWTDWSRLGKCCDWARNLFVSRPNIDLRFLVNFSMPICDMRKEIIWWMEMNLYEQSWNEK